MLKIKRRAFEKAVIQIVESTDIGKLIEEFSLHHVLFYSLLKDISRGNDSPNYHVLEKVARDKKIGEQFIFEQAKFVLSYLVPSDPREDYYKILNVLPTASSEEIRFNWLNLMKTHHPDRVGDQGLDTTKRLNEAYEVLANPKKRSEYDARHLSVLPIKIEQSWWIEIPPRKFVYPALLTVGIFTVIFYLAEFGLHSLLTEKKRVFIDKVENSPGKTKVPVSGSTIAVRKSHPSEPKREKRGVILPLLKQSGRVLITQEAKTEKNPGGGAKSALQSKETQKLAIKEPSMGKTEIEAKGVPKPKEEQSKYVVKKGDNLWDIARSFNTSVNDLKKTNNLKSNRLNLGGVLIIPVSRRKGIIKEEIWKEGLEKKWVEKPLKVAVRKQSAGLQGNGGTASQIGQKPRITKNIEREAESPKEVKEESKRETIAIKEAPNLEDSIQKLKSFSYPDKASLYTFVSDYVSSYKNRDMNLFMSFFEPDARENGVQLSKTFRWYGENFSSLEVIGYDVTIKMIDFEDDKAAINGDFLLIFRNKNDQRIKSSNGTINWALLWQGNRWRIKELNYRVKSTKVEGE